MSGSRDDTQKTSADAAAQQQQQNAQTNFNTQQKISQNLYGTNGSGGSVGSMTNPANLNVTSPTGPSKLQYDQAVQNTANQFQNARGQLSRYMATRGFGADSPSGFEASSMGQLARDEAGAQGQNFTNYTTQAYDDARQNFWNAANLESGNAATVGNQSVQAGSNAANVYANLYGNSYRPSIWQSIIPAAGQVAAAAVGGGA